MEELYVLIWLHPISQSLRVVRKFYLPHPALLRMMHHVAKP